jgi:hypothetical protein
MCEIIDKFPGLKLDEMTKSMLKDMALARGISNGYHDRVVSKMRKIDFSDYIREYEESKGNITEEQSKRQVLYAKQVFAKENAMLRDMMQTEHDREIYKLRKNARDKESELQNQLRELQNQVLELHIKTQEERQRDMEELIQLRARIHIKGGASGSWWLKRAAPPIETDNVPDNVVCPCCLLAKVNSVLNCTHVVCSGCLGLLNNKCPICRKDIALNEVCFFRL